MLHLEHIPSYEIFHKSDFYQQFYFFFKSFLKYLVDEPKSERNFLFLMLQPRASSFSYIYTRYDYNSPTLDIHI